MGRCRILEYVVDVCQLSCDFYNAYPSNQYPEIMRKTGRPYTCLLIETNDDYFICIPFRSSIRHNEAFLFTNTKRSLSARSGLDYKKVVLIKNLSYIDSNTPVVVDNDEYVMMMANVEIIIKEIEDYIKTYVNHVNGSSVLHKREFLRHYEFSTLPYFHEILGI